MMKKTVQPPRLKKGDLIAIAAPARPTEEAVLEQCVQGLEKSGFRVMIPSNAGMARGYLAGNDVERASEFMRAWENREAKALWCYRGGYGSTRLLDLLDYNVIRKNPKLFIGMSDITALHAAIQKKTGLSTLLGPGLFSLYSNAEKNVDYAKESIWSFISEDGLFPYYAYPDCFEENYGLIEVIKKGKAEGLSVGGNLSLICSLIGTQYSLDTKGKILFLEDVNEEPYRIDRMLQHLHHAGLLKEPAGVVLCTWRGCVSKDPHKSLTLREVFFDHFEKAPYPVLSGFPSGHIDHQATILLNFPYFLDSEEKRVHLCR